jgi:hypothetical protein
VSTPVPYSPALTSSPGNGRRVRIAYINADGEPSTRVIEPRRIFQGRNGYAYLRTYCHRRGEERTFRLDRFRAWEETARGGADPVPATAPVTTPTPPSGRVPPSGPTDHAALPKARVLEPLAPASPGKNCPPAGADFHSGVLADSPGFGVPPYRSRARGGPGAADVQRDAAGSDSARGAASFLPESPDHRRSRRRRKVVGLHRPRLEHEPSGRALRATADQRMDLPPDHRHRRQGAGAAVRRDGFGLQPMPVLERDPPIPGTAMAAQPIPEAVPGFGTYIGYAFRHG